MNKSNRATRAQLRGAPLKPECRHAKISKHESGKDDNRCFCLGLLSDDCETIADECYSCGAFAYNAKPLQTDERGEAEVEAAKKETRTVREAVVWFIKDWQRMGEERDRLAAILKRAMGPCLSCNHVCNGGPKGDCINMNHRWIPEARAALGIEV